MLRELARVAVVQGGGVGGAVAAVVFGLGVGLLGLAPGVAALLVSMVGVFGALAGYQASTGARLVTTPGGDGDGDLRPGVAGQMETVAVVGAGTACYGFAGMAIALAGG